jgi:hypothetical protein
VDSSTGDTASCREHAVRSNNSDADLLLQRVVGCASVCVSTLLKAIVWGFRYSTRHWLGFAATSAALAVETPGSLWSVGGVGMQVLCEPAGWRMRSGENGKSGGQLQ